MNSALSPVLIIPAPPALTARVAAELGKRGWLWKSGAVQTKNVSSIQNDSFLFFVQFVPAKIHHGYVAQMEL
jgi:hypothetical protein